MKNLKVLLHLLITLVAVAAFVISCKSDNDALNTVQNYTVTFQSNGGSEVSTVTTVEGLISEPTTPTKEGFTFEGWYTDSLFETLYESGAIIVCDITLYAKWSINSYTVNFVTHDINLSIAAQSVAYGALITEPDPEPILDGYSFEGWYTEYIYENQWQFSINTMPANNLTLYAKWEAETEKEVEIEDEAEDEMEEENEVEEETEAEEEAEDKTDNETEAEDEAEDDIESETETETEAEDEAEDDIESESVIKSVTVKFDVGKESFTNSSDASITISYGEKVTAPTGGILNYNLTFDNWYSDDTYTVAFNFDNIITQDTTIYGRWFNIAGIATYYNIEYATSIEVYHDATAMQIDTIIYGEAVVAPSLTPVAASTTEDEVIEFVGWYEYSSFESGEAYTFPTALNSYNNEIKLYAKYKIYTILKTSEVTFDYNGGSTGTDVENPQIVETNQYTAEPETPTKESAIFLGWYYNGVVFNFDSTPITEDITITAMWQEVEENAYIISNEAELQAFRDAVNFGSARTANAYLINDITITETSWTPIGNSTLAYFEGTFDGNDHTISGLTINATTQYQGLFGRISGATIKNLTLKEPSVTTTFSTAGSGAYVGAFVGGVVASTTSITLENLTLSGGSVSGISTVGGIIGASSTYNSSNGQVAYITNCIVEEGTTIYRTGDGYYAGCIAGYLSKSGSVIANCHNRGDLISHGSTGIYNAGIVGSAANTTIVGCSNSGSISSAGNCFGGIAGMAGINCTIIGCYNTGSISGTNTSYGKNGGGIVGYMNSSSLTLSSCYSIGVVTSSNTSSPAVGVLLGNLNSSAVSSAIIEACYYIGDTAIGSDSSSGKYSSNITKATSIAELNEGVDAMNSNATFSTYGYKYQIVDDNTTPTIVIR